ncbi:MAG: hypothetical protein LBM25_01920 [Bacteroidales bacterium]|jgi:hypothetical protein|nr:hypothetical protein [Bacteroidales bacterium]
MTKEKENKFKSRKSSSYKRNTKNRDLRSGIREPFIVLSFIDYDRNQGQSFEEWEEEKLLALAINKLRAVCQLTKIEATHQQIIKEYPKGIFPPNTEFYHPKHIPEDISWCSMHIQGKECVIGYFKDNIFNIVFLDKNHKFWITEKKNT